MHLLIIELTDLTGAGVEMGNDTQQGGKGRNRTWGGYSKDAASAH